jgi:hypothetical protein
MRGSTGILFRVGASLIGVWVMVWLLLLLVQSPDCSASDNTSGCGAVWALLFWLAYFVIPPLLGVLLVLLILSVLIRVLWPSDRS